MHLHPLKGKRKLYFYLSEMFSLQKGMCKKPVWFTNGLWCTLKKNLRIQDPCWLCAPSPLLAENDTMALISCSSACCSCQAGWGHPGPGPQLWQTHIMALQPQGGLGGSFLCHPQNGSLKHWWRVQNFLPLLDPRMLNCYKSFWGFFCQWTFRSWW